ncbi:MAG: Wzy polymerase domain-containing protein [Sideroxydans sp.]|nr:Wzy polymerase domain-containing protein [Sideroxydans sp.]
MWVLPFLYYHHAYPLTTFYQEWGAALLGVCALPLLLTERYWQTPEVPRIIMLPIGLMLVAMAQFFLGRIIHFDHLLLLSLYFLFAGLLMMLGYQLREQLGISVVVTMLAVFLVIGAELNTLAGVIQHYRWNSILSHIVTAKSSLSVYGNTAQPNHYANFISLGLFSLGFLYAKQIMRHWQAGVLALPMLFVLVLSGSRSAWLYLTFALALAWLWQRRDRSLRPVFIYAAMLWVGFLLMHFIVQISWLEGASGSVTSAERLFGEAGATSSGIRVHIWHEAMLILMQFPLFGAGFGQFAYQHFLLGAELQNPVITGLYNNSHNILFQLAAETGLVGIAVLLGSLGIWLWQSVVRDIKVDLEHWWGYSLLSVMAIHSLLEYPLWYLYFIGIAAVLLGLFDKTYYRLELRLVGRASVLAILVLGVISLVQAFQGYKHLERAFFYRSAAVKNIDMAKASHDELMAVYNYPLLSPYAELFIANMMDSSNDHLAEKASLNARAVQYIPNATVTYHQAIFLAWENQPEKATNIMANAIWSYPGEYPSVREELLELASQDPVRFAPLLEFATQKYEEYRRVAVPRK